jgi:hypothetical protein
MRKLEKPRKSVSLFPLSISRKLGVVVVDRKRASVESV